MLTRACVCLFGKVSIWNVVHSGSCPFEKGSIWDCAHSIWCSLRIGLFGMMYIWNGVHLGLNPFGIASIGMVFRGSCAFGQLSRQLSNFYNICTIDINLSVLFRTHTIFTILHNNSFTKIPALPTPRSFPNHQSLFSLFVDTKILLFMFFSPYFLKTAQIHFSLSQFLTNFCSSSTYTSHNPTPKSYLKSKDSLHPLPF